MRIILLPIVFLSFLFSQQYPDYNTQSKTNSPYPRSKIKSHDQLQNPYKYTSHYPLREEWRELRSAKQVTGNDATWETHLTGSHGYSAATTASIINDSLGNVYQVIRFPDPLEGNQLKLAVLKYSMDGIFLWQRVIGSNSSDTHIFSMSKARVLHDQSLHLVYIEENDNNEYEIYQLNYSSEGELLFNRKLYEQKSWYFSGAWRGYNVHLDEEGNCYFLRYNFPEESSDLQWVLEKFDKNGDIVHSYRSGNIDYCSFRLLVDKNGNIIVKRATDFSLLFYQFDDTLSRNWYYKTDISDEFSFHDMIIQVPSFFDSNNNLYFLNERIYPSHIVKINDQGSFVSEFPILGTDYNISAGINSNDNILLFSVENDYLRVSAYDTSGNMRTENNLNEDLLNSGRIYGISADQSGNLAIDSHIFDDEAALKLSVSGALKFTDNGLYEEVVDAEIASYDDHYSQLWSVNWTGPLFYEYSSFKSYVDEDGYTYTVGIQKLSGNSEVQFCRLSPDGNSEIQSLLLSGWDVFDVLQIDQIDNNRFICILNVWNTSENPGNDATIALIIDGDGQILTKRIYELEEKFKSYRHSHYPISNAGKGGYYYLAERLSNHDFENDKHAIAIKFMIFDRQGSRIANSYKEYTYGADGEYGISDQGFVIDADGSLNLFTHHSYSTSYSSDRRLRIYKVSLDNQLYITDNTSFYDDGNSYIDFGKQDNWGNLIYTLSGSDAHEYIIKLSTKGKIVWQTDTNASWSYRFSIVSEMINGKILAFGTQYESDHTICILLSKNGKIEIEKTIPWEFRYREYTIQENHIIFANNSAIHIFDTTLMEFVDEQEQADAYGRYFEVQDVSSTPDGGVFLRGTRNSYNLFRRIYAGHVIRFDSDVLRVDLENLPLKIQLNGNYPNPFNSQTAIRMQLPESGNTEIDVYNTLGQRVDTYSAFMPAGNQVYYFKNSALSSGTYFYMVRQNGRKATGKFVYVK